MKIHTETLTPTELRHLLDNLSRCPRCSRTGTHTQSTTKYFCNRCGKSWHIPTEFTISWQEPQVD